MGVVGSEYLSDGLHGSEGASVSVKGTDSLSFSNCGLAGLVGCRWATFMLLLASCMLLTAEARFARHLKSLQADA